MYRDHCLELIAPSMRADVAVFRRGAMFAVCSIRQATINVPDQIAVLFDGAEEENPLFGVKFASFEDIMGPLGADCWAELRAHKGNTKAACEYAIGRLLRVRGLGIVKAAFVAQLMGYDVACLDGRNVAREGRNPRAFETCKALKDKPHLIDALVRRYVSETFGKSEAYWDAWCYDVASIYGRSAQEISELHAVIVPRDYVPF